MARAPGAKLEDGWWERHGHVPWTIEEVDADTGMTAFDQEEEERTRICIWCGKICESIPALEEHEAECGDG